MVTKYQYNDDMDEISGFGGGYEATCRAMVVAALEWADTKSNVNPVWSQYSNIFGINSKRKSWFAK
jgi:hypothetical protein